MESVALGSILRSGPAAAAEAIGVPTVVGFFGVEMARSIVDQHGCADVVIANNVMAHVPDLNDFVGGLAELVADDGVLTIENPWVRDLVENVEFDTIYHEHYCYFSCTAVDALMRRHGLHLNDVEYFPRLHGGTLRWVIGRHPERTDRCKQYLADERSDGLTGDAYYERFMDRVVACQSALIELLTRLHTEGNSVAAYGAAAKGATLLNSSGIGTDLLSFVVDRNVHKQGKLMPGVSPADPSGRGVARHAAGLSALVHGTLPMRSCPSSRSMPNVVAGSPPDPDSQGDWWRSVTTDPVRGSWVWSRTCTRSVAASWGRVCAAPWT